MLKITRVIIYLFGVYFVSYKKQHTLGNSQEIYFTIASKQVSYFPFIFIHE